MGEIKGIYAAAVSILNNDLSLDVNKTAKHCENIIKDGCHGVVLFGSTGQSQLIPLNEKIEMINFVSKNDRVKDKLIIGTGLNSLVENINFLKLSLNIGLNKFLIMPPAYYNYGDKEVIEYYTKLIKSVPDAKIILYNFEKLCGYKFSVECVENLAARFPKNIIGVKDSSYNLMGNLNIKNFSILPGSELKLLSGLKKDCSGIITATCNVTAKLARKVFDDFEQNKEQTVNDKLCEVRKTFDQFNLISGLHSFLSITDKQFLNILPTCSLLNKQDEKILIDKLKDLDFLGKDFKAA
ncbi:dihydrodipicolinate synthase family protein [Candidatus Pelagibacter communis]|uniref:dihydrodipicolinate synthase family protein n=1 Tax=Pelagibacter ubique TaxID=198252 RepID=UPI00094BF2B9|nr:dihydrodipicolinate synthase family protein [Candidatus Pelagibacter ubique]